MTNITPVNPVFSNNRHRITFGYMAPEYGSAHRGCDLVPGAVGVTSDIVALEGGIIESVKDTVRTTLNINIASNWTHPDVLGNIVRIRHSDRYTTRYCHLAHGSIRVKAGDRVRKGQVIATIGNTGLSTAAHLHLEVFDNGNRIDPYPFMMGKMTFGLPALPESDFKTSDAMTALMYSAGLIKLTPEQKTRLDLNRDGNVTPDDALMILRVVAGMPANS